MTFSTTIFKNIFDRSTDVKVDFESFDQFEKSLYYLSTLSGYKPKKGEFIKKSSPLISPAIYKSGTTRANDNVIEWASWAALDVDNHSFTDNFEFELMTEYHEYRFVCYSSASSTRESPKFRLVFELNRPVEAKKIPHFWFALNSEFGQLGDKQTKDLSRMYYVPANYPNAYNFIFSNKDGKPLDVDKLMAKHPYTEVSSSNFIDRLDPELRREVLKRREAKLREESRSYSWTSYKDCPFVNKNLISEYRKICRVDGSGRYSMIYKIMTSIACNAVKSKYPISEYEITQLILELDRETSNRYSKRPLNVEASRAIEFAYRSI